MPWIPHSCYVGQKQNCKAKIGSCIAYTEYRECCCDRALIRRCKYRCNDNRISFGIFNAKQKKNESKLDEEIGNSNFKCAWDFSSVDHDLSNNLKIIHFSNATNASKTQSSIHLVIIVGSYFNPLSNASCTFQFRSETY